MGLISLFDYNVINHKKFVPSPTGDLHKCICGRTHQNHNYLDDLGHHLNSDWNPGKDTCELQTDAVGTLEFQGKIITLYMPENIT